MLIFASLLAGNFINPGQFCCADNKISETPVLAQASDTTLGQSDWQNANQNSGNLGQSEWQNPAQGSFNNNGQMPSQIPGLASPTNSANANQGLGQSGWQNPGATNQYAQSGQPAPQSNPYSNNSSGLNPSSGLNQSPGLGQSAWQQPQNAFQANSGGQQNIDYYNQSQNPQTSFNNPPPNYSSPQNLPQQQTQQGYVQKKIITA